MSNSRVNWSLLVLALVCLVPVVAGVALIVAERAPLGWALAGFFGAGVVVLGRKAFSRD